MPDRAKLLADLRMAVAIEDSHSNWTQADKAREARNFIRDHGHALIELVEREGEAQAAMDAAYSERNKLALLLAAMCEGTIQEASDASPGWTNVVLIPTSAGQVSFHLKDSEFEYALRCNISIGRHEWDGHTTEEKWERIARASGIRKEAT